MKNYLSLLYISCIIISILSMTFGAKHPKEEWISRSVYQLLTDRFAKEDYDFKPCDNLFKYCGGTFNGIKENLDYIAGMGFNAIWISPPLKNKEGSFHGYHNVDLYQINEHFGTAQELKDLIKACHNRDIWVILDAVPNHMADLSDLNKTIEELNPFNKSEHFHNLTNDYCWNYTYHGSEPNYKENCSIWGMPDLKQEDQFVHDELINWLKYMIKEYDFDGIRLADVKNVPKWFWKDFTEAADTYTLGIIGLDSNLPEEDINFIAGYQDYMDGVGDYPLFDQIRKSFCKDSMIDLSKFIQDSEKIYSKKIYNGIWVGNHDKPRFLHECNNRDGFRNAIIFILFYKGIPIFYYGDEQYFDGGNDPNNREILFGSKDTNSDLYKMIKIANTIRKKYKTYDLYFQERDVTDGFYAFTRGEVLIIVTNGIKQQINVQHLDYQDGDILCNQLSSDDCVTVKNGEIYTNMNGMPKIYIRQGATNNGKYMNFVLFNLFFLAFLFL